MLATNDGDNDYEDNNMKFYPHLSIVIETAPLLLILKSPQFAVRVSPFLSELVSITLNNKKGQTREKGGNTMF